MNFSRFLLFLGLTAFTTHAADESATTWLAFSDPTKPATLRVYVGHGDIRVQGASELSGEVTVQSNAMPEARAKTRPDGLRVVSAASSFSLSEKDNVISLDYGRDTYPSGGGTTFEIRVPTTTNVVVSGNWGGDVSVENISGDVDVKNMNQSVKLIGLSGGAIVESINGEVVASFKEVSAGRPISLTALNGKITLNVPSDAKANVRFRTQNGTILTDFDEVALATKTQPVLETAYANATEHARLAAADAKAAAEAARAHATAAAQEAVRRVDARLASRDGTIAPVAPIGPVSVFPAAPRAPRMPYIPAIAGGKVVSGTLNGGGAECQIATMNGDIIVRKLK